MTQKDPISWEDFNKIDMRVGTVISASPFEKAHKPAYQLSIDLELKSELKKLLLKLLNSIMLRNSLVKKL